MLAHRNTSSPKSNPQWAVLGTASYDHVIAVVCGLHMRVSFRQVSNRLYITCQTATQLLGVQIKSLFLQLLPLPQLSCWLTLE